MARARSIKPRFYANELLAECDIWARFIFPGLWQLADREGRLEDRPKRIKAELLPYDAPDVDPLLQQLADRGFILRYAVAGQRLIQVVNFARHQNPHHREPPSRLPAPPAWAAPTAQKPGADAASDADEASGEPGASPRQSGEETASHGPKAVLTPDSGLPEPDSLNLTPDSPSLAGGPSDTPAAGKPKRAPKSASSGPESKSGPVWSAYSSAFVSKYGTAPLRDGQVNAQLCKFVDRVGADDAPKLAGFYLQCDEPFYLQRVHPVDLLLRDAQKLRTMHATGKTSMVPNTQERLEQNNRAVASRALARSRHSFEGVDYRAGVGPSGELL